MGLPHSVEPMEAWQRPEGYWLGTALSYADSPGWSEQEQEDVATLRDRDRGRHARLQREGWIGEVEGLEISLAGAEEKLTQLDAALAPSVIHLGLPTFGQIAGRSRVRLQTDPAQSRIDARLTAAS
jgi:hypothetical protein